MILVEEAQAIMLAHARRTEAVTVPVWQAAGRVLAGDVTTDIDLSPFAIVVLLVRRAAFSARLSLGLSWILGLGLGSALYC